MWRNGSCNVQAVIRNTYHKRTNGRIRFFETEIHHEIDRTDNQRLNECTHRVITFIKQRGNSYLASNFARYTISQEISSFQKKQPTKYSEYFHYVEKKNIWNFKKIDF